jgi:2-haloacid dehalogenase
MPRSVACARVAADGTTGDVTRRRSLHHFSVLSFDCYDTLIDWERGIWEALRPLAARAAVTMDEVLARFARLESSHQASTPSLAYPEILRSVHRALAAELGSTTSDELDGAFASSVPEWPAFPDSGPALRRLSDRYRLVVLSNVDRAGFTASQLRLGVKFDAVYTAQDIGSYKPDGANFRYMLERLHADHGITQGQVLHTAQSLFHDLVPARRMGLATAWIDRRGLSAGGGWGATAPVSAMPKVDFVFRSLAEMADAVDG